MKVKLLNDGGFIGFSGVEFPLELEGVEYNGVRIYVPLQVMKDVPGFQWLPTECVEDGYYLFFAGEFEVVQSPNKRQEQLLSLIRDYGNPQTGLDRAERIYKQIEKIVKEELI